MTKTVGFEWGGNAYTVEKLRIPQAEVLITLLEQMASDKADGPSKFRALFEMLSLMNCPQEVIDDTPVDALGELIDALQAAHFGLAKTGADSGPPVDAGNP